VTKTGRPDAVLLGGGRNGLSVARSLGRAGVRVHAITYPNDPVAYSRYASRIDVPPGAGTIEASWERYLLGSESDGLRGSVLLTMNDAGILILNRNRAALAAKFILDAANPEAQLRMLDKLSTYEEARKAGVPTPKFWVATSVAQIRELARDLVLPLIVKPLFSHIFEQVFVGEKYLLAETLGEVEDAFLTVERAGIPCMLVEYLPGDDDLLCSYYTYVDEQGETHFDFTKRVVRRYPARMGLGSCHVTDWIPDVAQLGRRLLLSAGVRGLVNAEFKRDPRDGVLKLLECNARFTAATNLVTASGIDAALFIYNRLTGGPPVPVRAYRRGLMLWDPVRDVQAYLERRELDGLTFRQWLRSIRLPLVFPVLALDDPMPSFRGARGVARDGLRKVGRRVGLRIQRVSA
jgi:D-aspartate ligase